MVEKVGPSPSRAVIRFAPMHCPLHQQSNHFFFLGRTVTRHAGGQKSKLVRHAVFFVSKKNDNGQEQREGKTKTKQRAHSSYLLIPSTSEDYFEL